MPIAATSRCARSGGGAGRLVSPLLTGWLLVSFGPQVAFGTTAVIVATSGLPLLWTPKMPIAATQAGAFRAALPGVLFFLGDGFFAAGYVFVWQVALFLSLKQNVMAFGGALAIAAVVGAVGGLLLGRFINSGNGRRAVFVSSAFSP